MNIDRDNCNTQKATASLFSFLKKLLSEKHYRLVLGAFVVYVLNCSRGSVSWLSRVTGASRDMIQRGRDEILQDDPHVFSPRTRRPGGGRKAVEELQPELEQAVKAVVECESYGMPQDKKGRLYCALSLKKIVNALHSLSDKFKACPRTVLRLIRKLGYSKQQNKKALQCGKPHKDRNTQMEKIAASREVIEEQPHNPVISVDAKAKVFFNNLLQKGRQWRQKGDPVKVLDHDYPEKGKKGTPMGVYDLINNRGFVNFGLSHDTAEFAVESIRQWWLRFGRQMFPDAEYLTILCDGGGSNGYRLRLWKYELAKLADEIGLPILVHHYPPGCSKFNPIEHRMFNIISMNWAGQPFTDAETVIRYIEASTTSTGLSIGARLDEKIYPKGIKVSDEQFDAINMIVDENLGTWNYLILGLSKAAFNVEAA